MCIHDVLYDVLRVIYCIINHVIHIIILTVNHREEQQPKWKNNTTATYYAIDKAKIQQFDTVVDKVLPPAPAPAPAYALTIAL